MKDVYTDKTAIQRAALEDFVKRSDEIEKSKAKLMDRILKSHNDAMIERYENEIISLDEEQSLINEKMAIKKRRGFYRHRYSSIKHYYNIEKPCVHMGTLKHRASKDADMNPFQ